MSGSGQRHAAIEAPAKVNLRLRVLAREESGFHSLETVFCAISLADELRIEEGGAGIRLRVEGGGDLGPPERNLAVRAAEAFFSEVGRSPAIEIFLRKRTPSAAGLGGGSSDAAAVLLALDALHGGPLPRSRLLQVGIALGSDVPFFLCGSPLALAWGRGERLLPLPPLRPLPVLIVVPPFHSPTPAAYRALADHRAATARAAGAAAAPRPAAPARSAGAPAVIAPESFATWNAIATIAENHFQPVLEARHPELAAARESLQTSGATLAMLSGSGSAIFALFPSPATRDAAHHRFTTEFPGFSAVPTRTT